MSAKHASIEQMTRPFALRALNRIGNIIDAVSPSTLDFDQLVKAARKKTGRLADPEADFVLPLKTMIGAINSTAKLDFVGRQLAKQTLIAAIVNQINIRNELDNDPSITRETIQRPLFVIGFPRTGTTFIHNLLALDDNSRAPKMWEVINPTVISRLSENEQRRRIKEAEKFVKFANYLIPQLNAIHELSADGPDECLKLIENTFVSPHFCMYFDIPDYWNWLLTEGQQYFVKVYEYHRTQLQILQKGCPPSRWVLKTPLHLYYLDALLHVYPDACVVNMQRDPLECVPSFCSLVGVNRALFSESSKMSDLGRFSLEFYVESNRRAIAAQQKARPGAIIDIQYRDFVKDPKSTIAKIYDYFGLGFSENYERKIDRWMADHPKNKHGVHSYTLEQFGLNEGKIRREYERLHGMNPV